MTSERRRSLGAAVFFLALLVLAFPGLAGGGRTFFHIDLFYEYGPVWGAVQRALLAGAPPFWLDGEWCGHPVLYHQEAPLFHPLTVPLLLAGLAPHRAMDLFSLFHFWLAGVGAFQLVRERTGGFVSALLAGTAFMLGTRTVLSALWPTSVAAFALLPFALLGILRIGDGGRRRGVPILAVSLGLMLLLGRPQSVLAFAPLAAAVAVSAWLGAENRSAAVRRLGLGLVLAALLGMPYLLPAALLHGQMARPAEVVSNERDAASLGRPGHELARLLEAPAQLEGSPEAFSWPGLVPLCLAAGGLVFVRRAGPGDRSLGFALATAAVFGIALALGDAGPWRLAAHVPLLSGFRAPVRFLAASAAAIALGSGFVAAAIERRGRRGTALATVLLVATLLDLLVHARRGAQTADARVFSVEPRIATWARTLPADGAGFPARIWTVAPFLFSPALGGPEGPGLVAAHEPLALARAMAHGVDGVTGGGPPLARTYDVVRAANERAVELTAAARVLLPGPTAGFAPDPASPPGLFAAFPPLPGLPRAFAVPDTYMVPPGRALEAAMSPSFPAARAALVEEGSTERHASEWGARTATVHLDSRAPGRVSVRTELPGPGLLVLLESWEAGWSATVDGRPAPVLRTNHAFRGIRLAGGRHDVVFRYRPRGVPLALALAALGLAGTLAAVRTRRPA